MHLFGTGHSRIPVEELFPRYGSYPGFHPIVELSMTFHTQVVGANGQRQAMFIERVEGLADVVLANFELGPPDAMIVFSASGLTAVPIEIARGARARGLPVDRGHLGRAVARRRARALLRHAAARPRRRRARPLHAARRRDRRDRRARHARSGRARRSPAVALANELKVQTAELLVARGAMPPVITSGALVGRERSRELFDAAYAEHARRAARVLRGASENARKAGERRWN